MIVLLAPIFQEKHFKQYKVLSIAANKWCNHLLKELTSIEECIVLYHINEPLFPKGKIYLSTDHYFKYNAPVYLLSYINVPIIRTYSLNRSYKTFIEKKIDITQITHVITYNRQLSSTAKYLQQYGIKWSCIYADANTQNELISDADFHIYLSYYAYKNSKFKNKFHFDGGIYNLNRNEGLISQKKIFLYSGAIRKENGVELMIETFKQINNSNIELWICGKGKFDGFDEKVKSDKRIKYYGLVSEKRLNDLYNQTFCFLNPRLTSSKENNYNFPSKLFDYFSYGRPIISTYTEGIAPFYKDYLIITEDSVDALKKTIERVLSWNKTQLYDYSNKIKHFEKENIWNKKVRQLWNFISH